MIRTTLYSLLILGSSQVFAAESIPYSHGNPSAEEQYMLELVNRARANPTAEGLFLANTGEAGVDFGIEFFHVNLARLELDFASYAPRPPLAFNAKLLASSRRQSKDMAKNNFQDHVGSDGSTISSRVADADYAASSASENIYSNLVSTTLFAHAGFNIDWGNDTDGVQADLGHRMSIMGFGPTDYREIGISIVSRRGADAEEFGKLSVTQDFGNRSPSPDFLLGVAYYDVNENGICEPGEGLSGIKVKPATGSWHAVTSTSGGYSIPFSTDPGASDVTFSGGGLKTPLTKDFTIDGENKKVDLRITSGTPFVSLVPLDKIAGETTDGDASFRIVRVGPDDGALTIIVGGPTKGGSGIASPGDYKLSAVAPARVKKSPVAPGQFFVTIPANKSFAEIKLTAAKDKKTEPVENAVFSMIGSSAYRTGDPNSVRILIKP
ncbi:MAG: CAP domain-containing protein [Luteolibacter sp.]|uniref:CAP domain-containing protein n=1 Tax=Luteolibacter sp. TaxID=1962973 RepID=UPI003267DD4F